MRKALLSILALLLILAPSLALADFEYDGTNESHVANNPNAGTAGDHTVCAWVYSATWDDDEALFAYGNGTSGSSGRGFQMQTKTTGAIRWNEYSGASVGFGTTTTTMSDATWHHVCFVFQASGSEFFYLDATDDTADDTLSIAAPTAQNSTDDAIIAEALPNDALGLTDFAGKVAHFAYWDTALSGAQVGSLADKSTCPLDVASANIQVFMPGTADPMTEDAQSLSVTTNGTPVFTSDSPTGLPSCGTFASVGSFINVASKTSEDPYTPTTSAQLEAGNLAVLVVAADNLSGTDGNTTDIVSVTDTASNTWTKVREYTYAEGGAGKAATVAVFQSKISTQLASSSTLTIEFSANITAKAVTGWEFTMGSGTIATDGTSDLNGNSADPASDTATGSQDQEHIWVRAIAQESNSSAFTGTSGWTVFSHNQTTGGASHSNMGSRVEFKIESGTTSSASDPTTTSADHASTLIGLIEQAAGGATSGAAALKMMGQW